MKKLILPAAAILFVAGLAWAPPAEARPGWVFGTAFEVGGVHFKIGYHDHKYYYRTPIELGVHYYGRPHRSKGCYRRGGHYYHGHSCPLIHDYFRRHGFSAHIVFDRYAPHHGYRGHYRDHGYGHYDDYGHHGRYRDYRDHGRYRDRHYRDHRRYRGHHRGYRGHHRGHHGHGPSCRY